MTKVHFARLAKALLAYKHSEAIEGRPVSNESYEALCDQVALACGEANQRFDYTKFMVACGN